MNRLKGIKNIADLKELLFLHKESIKKAALPVTVMAALLIFWIGGDGDKQEVEEVNSVSSDVNIEQSVEEESQNQNVTDNAIDIYVDIGGCVNKPGVYKIVAGTRLFQVIEKAGGLTEDADLDSINQAEEVYDGQKILIFPKNADDDSGNMQMSSDRDLSGKININNADASKLQEIPGVGPVTSQSIIDYRESIGRFKSIEDIKNVSGIGEKTFEKLKEHITV